MSDNIGKLYRHRMMEDGKRIYAFIAKRSYPSDSCYRGLIDDRGWIRSASDVIDITEYAANLLLIDTIPAKRAFVFLVGDQYVIIDQKSVFRLKRQS